VAILD